MEQHTEIQVVLLLQKDFNGAYILNSKRNAYFAYLVQCINWGLNTDLMICKVTLMY